MRSARLAPLWLVLLLGSGPAACTAEAPRTKGPARLPSPKPGPSLAPSRPPSAAPSVPTVAPTPSPSPAAASAGPSAGPSPAASPAPRLTFPLRLSPSWGSALVGELNASLLGDRLKVASPGSVVQLDEQGRLLANNGGSLIGNHGGGIISDQGGGLVSNHGGGLLGNHGAGFRLAQAEPEATLPTLTPAQVELLFQLSKRYALRIVDLTAFIDQAMLAWAQGSPVLGRWSRFELQVSARVDLSATTVPDLFPSLYQGQRLAMSALARVEAGRLQVAMLRGSPEAGLQWLLVEAEPNGACHFTYDVGPMTNALLLASPADPKLRLALQGDFRTDRRQSFMAGDEQSAYTAVAEAQATQGLLVAGTEDHWRLTPEPEGLVLAAAKHISSPTHPPDSGRLAMRVLPDGRAVYWVAEADPASSPPERRFQYVAPDGSHQRLQGTPPAWFLGPDGLRLPFQPELASALPAASALDGLKLLYSGLPVAGERPSPFSWRPVATEGLP